jgi:hypothetical protein
MFNEFELACWVKFIEKFNLLEESYHTYEAQAVLSSALWQIFYIAVATKSILN